MIKILLSSFMFIGAIMHAPLSSAALQAQIPYNSAIANSTGFYGYSVQVGYSDRLVSLDWSSFPLDEPLSEDLAIFQYTTEYLNYGVTTDFFYSMVITVIYFQG